MKTRVYRCVGIFPILLHNGQTADPLNKFSKQLKVISSKRKKTDEDHHEMARIEWHAGLYVNADGRLILPSDFLEATIINGAKKKKNGTKFRSAVFVTEDCELVIPKKYKTAEELWNYEEFRDSRGVRVGQAKVIRTRPIFREWSVDVPVTYDPNQVNEAEIDSAMEDAGSMVGFGDFRPKYGRFDVTVL